MGRFAWCAVLGIGLIAAPADDPSRPPERRPGTPFRVVVVDEVDGRPIAGATVRAETAPGSAVATTDADGLATLPGPRSRRYEIRVDAWADGHQFRRSWFTNETRDPRMPPLPGDAPVRLRLVRGERTVGGRVVDAQARPIAGVELALFGERAGRNDSAFHGLAVRTDADGRWSSGMPADLARLGAHFRHPDHLADLSGGSIDLARALDRTQVNALAPGVRLRGRVVDAAGRPIAVGKIRPIGRRPGPGDNAPPLPVDPAEMGGDGRFAFPSAFPDDGQARTLLVTAPGFAPGLVSWTPKPGGPELEIRLDAGKVVLGRAVDPEGRPIADVRILTDHWRGWTWQEVIGLTDAEGRVRWDGAPNDEVALELVSDGHRMARAIVTPGNDERVWTLEPTLEVDLRVDDADAGWPIRRFDVQQGRVDPASGTVTWLDVNPNSDVGFAGRAHASLDTRAPAWRLRVLAQGYRTWESREIRRDEGRVRLIPQLERLGFGEGGGPSGTVVDPDGRPVDGAEVMMVADTPSATLFDAGSWWLRGAIRWTGDGTVVADGRGRFTFRPPVDPACVLAAAHPTSGYIESNHNALNADGRLVLRPWGRVEGVARIDGQPAALATIDLRDDPVPGPFPRFRTEQSTTADADGRFQFHQVPPGRIRVSIRRQDGGGPVSLQVESGETAEVALGR